MGCVPHDRRNHELGPREIDAACRRLDATTDTSVVGCDRLHVVGLQAPEDRRLSYASLDEALSAGGVHITEVSAAGAVNEILVQNHLNTPVFVMLGDEVTGSKQNRTFVSSFMVPPTSQQRLPVACIERGRWHSASPRFGSAGRSSHARLRRQLIQMVHTSCMTTGAVEVDQRAVWSEVGRKLHALRCQSPTGSLSQAYVDWHGELFRLAAELRAPAECCGVAFVIDGKTTGIDIFDKAETLGKQWRKLVAAHLLDALELRGRTPGPLDPAGARTCVRSALDGWGASSSAAYDSAGMGTSVRLERPTELAAALVVGDVAVHIAICVGA